MAELKGWTIQRTQTAATVANQQYYHNPPDMIDIQSITQTISGIAYPLQEVDAQKWWDVQNMLAVVPTAVPQLFFQRKRDYGLWPIPQAVYTLTLVYQPRVKDMTTADYATGTITATNNSQTITGSGTTFTAQMIGRWLQVTAPTGDGLWYLITTVSSATSLTLEEAYQGTTASGAAYTIGESPVIPEEGHELLAYRAAEMYFMGFRRDPPLAAQWGNKFWTGDFNNNNRNPDNINGGFIGLQKRYSRRSESRLLRSGTMEDFQRTKIWATSIVQGT